MFPRIKDRAWLVYVAHIDLHVHKSQKQRIGGAEVMEEGSQRLSLGDTALTLNKKTLTHFPNPNKTNKNMLHFASQKSITEFPLSHHGSRLFNFILNCKDEQNTEEPENIFS